MSHRPSRWDQPPPNYTHNQHVGRQHDAPPSIGNYQYHSKSNHHDDHRTNRPRSRNQNPTHKTAADRRKDRSRYQWTRDSNHHQHRPRPFHGTGTMNQQTERVWTNENPFYYGEQPWWSTYGETNPTENFTNVLTPNDTSAMHSETIASTSANLPNHLSSSSSAYQALPVQVAHPKDLPFDDETAQPTPVALPDSTVSLPMPTPTVDHTSAAPHQTDTANECTSTKSSASPAQSHSREQINRKLITQLTRMDKHNIKHMINDPNSKYATALQSHARLKNRQEMRKQLRIIGGGTQDALDASLEPDECVDSSILPADIFEQINRALSLDTTFALTSAEDDDSEATVKRTPTQSVEYGQQVPSSDGGAGDDQVRKPQRRISHYTKSANVATEKSLDGSMASGGNLESGGQTSRTGSQSSEPPIGELSSDTGQPAPPIARKPNSKHVKQLPQRKVGKRAVNKNAVLKNKLKIDWVKLLNSEKDHHDEEFNLSYTPARKNAIPTAVAESDRVDGSATIVQQITKKRKGDKATHTYFTDCDDTAVPITTETAAPEALSEPIDADEELIPIPPLDNFILHQPDPLRNLSPTLPQSDAPRCPTKHSPNTTITAAAAEFIETADGRMGQRTTSTTLKDVPRRILSAISKRLQEFNADKATASSTAEHSQSSDGDRFIAKSSSTDSVVANGRPNDAGDASEEEVIDVTPEVPSVDLTGDANEVAPTTPMSRPTPQNSSPTPQKSVSTPEEGALTLLKSTPTPLQTAPTTLPSAPTPTQNSSTNGSSNRSRQPIHMDEESIRILHPEISLTRRIKAKRVASKSPDKESSSPPKIPLSKYARKNANKKARRKQLKALNASLTVMLESTPVVPESTPIVSEATTLVAPPKVPETPSDVPQPKPAMPGAPSIPPAVDTPLTIDVPHPTDEPLSTGGAPADPSPTRLWRSPGEKKCIESRRKPSAIAPKAPPPAAAPVNDQVLQRMRDIDNQMMGLQKKKIDIEQMILQHQHEKMAIEMNVMQLQNERTQLLGQLLVTSATTLVISDGVDAAPTTTKNPKPPKKSRTAHNDDDESAPPRLAEKRRPKTKKPSAKRTKRDSVSSQSSATRYRRVVRTISSDDTDDSDEKPLVAPALPSNIGCPEFQQILQNPGRICLKGVSSKAVSKTYLAKPAGSSRSTPESTSVSKTVVAAAPNGLSAQFTGHRSAILHVQVVDQTLVAASESGHIYQFDLLTGRLLETIKGHTLAVTGFVFTVPHCILSISLDGYIRINHMVNYSQLQMSHDYADPLLQLDSNWDNVYIGSKKGNVYMYRTVTNRFPSKPLCRLGHQIAALRAQSDGARHTLIIATAVNSSLQVRDATTGLLLRIIEVPDKIHVCSILLDGGVIRCGTNERHILSFEFSSGHLLAQKLLNFGLVCCRVYGAALLLCGSCDGHIDAFDKTTGDFVYRVREDRSRSLLDFVVVDDKIIVSTREDRGLRSITLPLQVQTYKSS